MTNENANNQDNRIHYLYRITNKINGKIYIGQSVDTIRRWYEHKREAAQENPGMLISRAIKKYGNNSFEFEVIACCKSLEYANETEILLITQYDSFINNGKGYNVTFGGMNSPKSEEFKQMMRDWHASLSPEEKERINKLRSEATIKQIETQGHPALGTKRTDEQCANISAALKALDKDKIYTEEVRQHMSESHIGHKDSKETKQRKSSSIKLAWEERVNYDNIKCEAPGCKINGKTHYMIVNGIRYCQMHGQRLKRTGLLDLLPHSSHNKGKPTSEEVKQKLKGRIPHNKMQFTQEQINCILNDSRSSRKVAKEYNVTEKVIIRVRRDNK